MAEDRDKALDGAGPDREAVRKGSVMRMGDNLEHEHRVHPDRGAVASTWPWASADCRGAASWRSTGRSRPVSRPWPCTGGRGPAQRRHLRLHRRRARHGPGLRPGHRGQRRRPAHLPARHRGAGPRDRRHADPLRSAGHDRDRLGGRADPRAEIEGEMGDSHVGLQARLMSQALRKLTGDPVQVEHHRHLHQPAAGEDRRDVRQPGGHPRWPGAEVLRLDPPGHSADRVDQGRRRGGRATGPGSRW